MYGVKQEEQSGEGDDEEEDIEAAVRRELDSIKADGGVGANGLFTPVKLNVDCLLFIKTKPPVEPVAFVKRICEDAKTGSGHTAFRPRYVNRLTPVVAIGKATEQGLVDVARKTLSPYFDLSGKKAGSETKAPESKKSAEDGSKPADRQPGDGSDDETSRGGGSLQDKPADNPIQGDTGVEVPQSCSVSTCPHRTSDPLIRRSLRNSLPYGQVHEATAR